MKIVVEAKKYTDRHYGDVHLKAGAGEKLTLTPPHAEVALATGDFEFVEEITETKADEAFLQNQQTEIETRKSELMLLGKEELIEQAKDLEGYKSSLKKEELVDLILKPRAAVTVPQTHPPDEGDQSGE